MGQDKGFATGTSAHLLGAYTPGAYNKPEPQARKGTSTHTIKLTFREPIIGPCRGLDIETSAQLLGAYNKKPTIAPSHEF